MKVLISGGHPGIHRYLAGCPGVSLSLLVHPTCVERFRQQGIYAHVFPYSTRAKVDLRATRQIYRAVKVLAPDLLHVFYPRALSNALAATSFMKPRPRIVSFRGTANLLSKFDPGNHISYLHSRVAAHACESEAVRQRMIESGVAPAKCFSVFNCVTSGAFSRPGRAALAAWDVPRDAFVVGTIANMRPAKGIDILLRAAMECADLQDVYWVLIGRVGDRRVARLAQDTRRCPRVRLLGYRPDAVDLISGADVFVMPSRTEALCVALLEAMSQRVCPVVSDAGGMKEVVRHGRDGLVVPKDDVAALAAAIRTLHADRQRARDFASAAAQRVAETFSPDKMGERVWHMYQQVVGGRVS